MVAATVLFSSAGVVIRHVERAPALEMVFWRSLFAFVFVLAFLSLRQKAPWQALRAVGWPGLVSGVMWAIAFTAFVVALSLTSVANALVLSSLGALITVFLARLVLREAVPPRTWVAAGVAAAGIAWMFGDGFSAAQPGRHLAGMAMALVVAIAASINVVTLRACAARLDLIPAVMLGAALACLLTLPFSLPFSASARDVALLALLGIFQIAVPCMLVVVAARTLLAPEIALLWLLETVLGPLWAWLGAGEVPAYASLAGGLLVLAALAGNELAAMGSRARAAYR
jgi:drug/metabolite transporter (DMT)-like permease